MNYQRLTLFVTPLLLLVSSIPVTAANLDDWLSTMNDMLGKTAPGCEESLTEKTRDRALDRSFNTLKQNIENAFHADAAQSTLDHLYDPVLIPLLYLRATDDERVKNWLFEFIVSDFFSELLQTSLQPTEAPQNRETIGDLSLTDTRILTAISVKDAVFNILTTWFTRGSLTKQQEATVKTTLSKNPFLGDYSKMASLRAMTDSKILPASPSELQLYLEINRYSENVTRNINLIRFTKREGFTTPSLYFSVIDPDRLR